MPNTVNDSDLRETILTNELGNRMLDMIAPVYDNSKVALYLFQALGAILEKQTDFIANDYVKQIRFQTATWGLKYWEDEYGITPDPALTLEQRRDNIIKCLQYKAPITPKKIADRVSAMVGLPTIIQEVGLPNTFEVLITDYTPDYVKVAEILDKIVPAHLNYILSAHDTIEADMRAFYVFTVSEYESLNLGFTNNPTDNYERIADEDNVILLDENGDILTYV